jgi:hypothetical protein
VSLSRKSFLTHTAAAAGALAFSKVASAADAPPPAAKAGAAPAAKPPPPPPPSAIHFPVLKPAEFEQKKMLDALKVKKEHKVVFHSVEPLLIIPGLSSLYIHIQNALNAGEFSMGWGKNMAAAAVFIGPSVTLALNDAMWAKYNIGAVLNLKDANGKPETANVYYKAQTPMGFEGDPGAGGNVYQDWSGEACLKRGTTFMLCHNALTAFAGRFAMESGGKPAEVLAEWKANLLPGFLLVPAGVGALQVAMENGWKMIPII